MNDYSNLFRGIEQRLARHMRQIFIILILLLNRDLVLDAQVGLNHDSTDLEYLLTGLNLQTGDLILFESHTFNARMTQLGTLSPYSHSGLVIRDYDGSLWLTHATDNDYDGFHLNIPGEDVSRGGVIMTRLKDSFLSSGFYKRIYLVRWDERWASRPQGQDLRMLYQKYKDLPFEESKMRFILAAFDLQICERDLLAFPDMNTLFCSEYLVHLLSDLQLLGSLHQEPNEFTPLDVRQLPPFGGNDAIVFEYNEGAFSIRSEKGGISSILARERGGHVDKNIHSR